VRGVPGDERQRPVRRDGADDARPAPHRRPRRRPHVPEHRAVAAPDRRGQPDAGAAPPHPRRVRVRRPAAAVGEARGRPAPGPGPRHRRVRRRGAAPLRPRGHPALRRPEAAGTGARAGDGAPAAAPGRAGRRHERRGAAADDRGHRPRPRRPRPLDPDRRARHGHGHAAGRRGHRPGLRPAHRERRTGAGAARSRRDPCLPRRRARPGGALPRGRKSLSTFIELVINGISAGSVYALIALGFVIIFKATEVVNFAHASLLLAGGYITAVLHEHIGFLAALAAGIAGAAVLGVLVEVLILRRARVEDQAVLAIVTIGIDIVLATELTRRIGTQVLSLGDPWQDKIVYVGGVGIAQTRIAAFAAAALIITAFLLAFRFTSWGVAMRAAAEDGETAALMGIRLSRVS